MMQACETICYNSNSTPETRLQNTVNAPLVTSAPKGYHIFNIDQIDVTWIQTIKIKNTYDI